MNLIVADGNGYEHKDGVNIYDIGIPNGRISRIFRSTASILAKAKQLEADIYHLHDPELIPVGINLKGLGKKGGGL